jgi:hypothetical protein
MGITKTSPREFRNKGNGMTANGQKSTEHATFISYHSAIETDGLTVPLMLFLVVYQRVAYFESMRSTSVLMLLYISYLTPLEITIRRYSITHPELLCSVVFVTYRQQFHDQRACETSDLSQSSMVLFVSWELSNACDRQEGHF